MGFSVGNLGYDQVIQQLNNRANLESKRPNIADVGTQVVGRVDKELTAGRDFQKELVAKGKKIFTSEMAQELVQSHPDIKPEDVAPFIGLATSPDELDKFTTQKVLNRKEAEATDKLKASQNLTDEQKNALDLPEGKKQFAENQFKDKKAFKIIPIADPTSSTGQRWQITFSDGSTQTGDEAPKNAGGKGGTNTQERFLLNSFLKESKNFKDVASNYQRVKSSAENTGPAGDLSLIFAYMKMLDPSSVVREGEQASAENARGVPEGIRATYNKVIGKGKLGDQQRQDFLKNAESIYNNEETLHSQREDEYKKQASLSGLDPASVTMELRPKFKKQDEKKVAPATQDEMVSVIRSDGTPGKIPKSKLEAALKAGYKRGTN